MPTVTIGNNTGNTYSGFDTSYIYGSVADTNYSTDTQCWISGDGSVDIAIFRVTGLSNIPASTIDGATIYFYKIYEGWGSDSAPNIRRLLRAWVLNQVTWNSYSSGNSWGTAGAAASTDRSDTITATGSWGRDEGAYKSFTSSQLVTDTQDIVDGDITNNGYRIGGTNISFIRLSPGTDGQRPYMSVTYTATGGSSVSPYYYMMQQ